MLYIYHASSIARYANVIYIYIYHTNFGNAVSPFFFFLYNVSIQNQFLEPFPIMLECKKL